MKNSINGNEIKIKLIKSECEYTPNLRCFKSKLKFQFEPYLIIKRDGEYIEIKDMMVYRNAYEIEHELIEIDNHLCIEFTDGNGNYRKANKITQYVNINEKEFNDYRFNKSESILRNFILSYDSEYSVLVGE